MYFSLFSFSAPENQRVTDVISAEVVKECGEKFSRDDIRGKETVFFAYLTRFFSSP